MRFTKEQIDGFIKVYKSEYGETLDIQEAVKQIYKLTTLIALLVLPKSIYSKIAFLPEESYTHNAEHKVKIPLKSPFEYDEG